MVIGSEVTARPGILVVEDDPDVRSSAGRLLQPEFRVFEAATAADARRIWSEHPELRAALLDLQLPEDEAEKDRIEVGLGLLEDLGRRAGALLVVQSAYVDDEDVRRQAQRRGATGVFEKTQGPEPWLNLLHELMIASVPVERDEPPTTEPVPEGLSRQWADHDAVLGDASLLRRYAGQVVVVHAGRVYGHGDDYAAAARDAASRIASLSDSPASLPPVAEMTYVVVPLQPASPSPVAEG